MLDHQLAWYVAGPVLGLCVLACRSLFNGRLGVTGGFSEIIGQVSRGSARFDWRGWFAIGSRRRRSGVRAAGRRSAFSSGYGWMTETFHGADRALIPVILLGAGVLIGFGAKAAGGCTSGNGLSGSSLLSPASLAATATFFATAIAASFLIEAVI